MKSKILLTLVFSVCAAMPVAAQTTAPQDAERKRDSAQPEQAERKRDSAQPEQMVQIPAGKFWMGRSYTIYVDSADLLATDRRDDRPANNIYLDAFYLDKYEVKGIEIYVVC